MGFSLFNKKQIAFLSDAEKAQVVQAIRDAETRTSGEIRIYIESHCKYVNPVDRAKEIFFSLKMDQTQERNAVVLYLAVKDHQLAVWGDEGIHQKTGATCWNAIVTDVLAHFNKGNFVAGICEYIHRIGEELRTFFPYNSTTDHNELPDDIVFGR